MHLLAALAAGLTVYLAAATALGVRPGVLRRSRSAPSVRGRAATWLAQAGVSLSPGRFVAVCALGGLVVGIAVGLLLGVAPLGAVAGVAVAWAPVTVLSKRRAVAVRSRTEAWPDALRDLAGHLRSATSVHGAMVELGRSGPLPLREPFTRYAALSQALDPAAALDVVRSELADPVSDRVVEVLLVALDQGSSIVIDVLGEMAVATTADLRLLEEITTAQLETKVEAWSATALPFVVLALLCVSTPGYRDFYSSAAGWVVVGVGLGLCAVGLVAITRLGRIPEERRVLIPETVG